MSYTPTQWNTGDTITASALNKIEQGIANAGASTIITDTSGTLNKTFSEIANLLASGVPCYIQFGTIPSNPDTTYDWAVNLLPLQRVAKYDVFYRVYALNNNGQGSGNASMNGTPEVWSYSAESMNDYPTFYRRTYVGTSYVTTVTSK